MANLQIHTDRLRLFPLSMALLRVYLGNPEKLSSELGYPLADGVKTISEPVQRAITIKLANMAKVDEAEHLWMTYWLVVTQDEPTAIGMVGFKGVPQITEDPACGCQVEIGYGISSAFQGRGYATEAVQALVDWALYSAACDCVIAEVHKTNIPSIRVLEKVGMIGYRETDIALLYRITRR
jgi:ribosomal-protein-alanine N-acetyltransferase